LDRRRKAGEWAAASGVKRTGGNGRAADGAGVRRARFGGQAALAHSGVGREAEEGERRREAGAAG